jgi:hypothetical protein
VPGNVGENVLVVASFQKVGDVLVDCLWKPGPPRKCGGAERSGSPRSSRSIGDELVLSEVGEDVLDEDQLTSLKKAVSWCRLDKV